MKLRINSGNHELINTPVFFDMQDVNPLTHLYLADISDENKISSASPIGNKHVFVVNYMAENTSAEYEIKHASEIKDKVDLIDLSLRTCAQTVINENEAAIFLNGEYIASYYFKTDIPKPYLGPFKAANGDYITRCNYTGNEHPHHRSIWFSHGEINGSDIWGEPQNHGYILNKSIRNILNMHNFTSFTAFNTWTHHDKTPIADDITVITVYNTDCFTKIIDVDLTLTASYGDVTLGQTKEAGNIAVRMADSLIVDNGGTIVNSYGAVNEREIWMKRSCFNDYYGKVSDGKIYGIAIFDNPENENYPSYWHTRDYGLMAVNNFYVLGEKVIKKGESVNYKYRIIVHENDTETAKINTLFNNYITPPSVEIYE